jgi:hypothetical protein
MTSLITSSLLATSFQAIILRNVASYNRGHLFGLIRGISPIGCVGIWPRMCSDGHSGESSYG